MRLRHVVIIFATFGGAILANAQQGGAINPLPPPPASGIDAIGSMGTAQPSVPDAVEARQTAKPTLKLSSAPQLQPASGASAAVASSARTENVRPVRDLKDLSATVAESAYPETVRSQAGGFAVVNVPPGWEIIPVRTLRYNPPPQIQLANGDTFTVESAPYVLIPASKSARVAINPKALQILHNYYRAQEEMMRQLEEGLKPTVSEAKID